MRVSIVKQDRAFLPVDDRAKEAFSIFSQGDEVVIDLRKQRNPKFHRYAMNGLQGMYDMVEESIGFESWRRLMTIKAGYFTSIGKIDIDGNVTSAVTPESLSFENMDEIEFRKTVSDIHQAFINKYGERVSYEDLVRVVMQ